MKYILFLLLFVNVLQSKIEYLTLEEVKKIKEEKLDFYKYYKTKKAVSSYIDFKKSHNVVGLDIASSFQTLIKDFFIDINRFSEFQSFSVQEVFCDYIKNKEQLKCELNNFNNNNHYNSNLITSKKIVFYINKENIKKSKKLIEMLLISLNQNILYKNNIIDMEKTFDFEDMKIEEVIDLVDTEIIKLFFYFNNISMEEIYFSNNKNENLFLKKLEIFGLENIKKDFKETFKDDFNLKITLDYPIYTEEFSKKIVTYLNKYFDTNFYTYIQKLFIEKNKFSELFNNTKIIKNAYNFDILKKNKNKILIELNNEDFNNFLLNEEISVENKNYYNLTFDEIKNLREKVINIDNLNLGENLSYEKDNKIIKKKFDKKITFNMEVNLNNQFNLDMKNNIYFNKNDSKFFPKQFLLNLIGNNYINSFNNYINSKHYEQKEIDNLINIDNKILSNFLNKNYLKKNKLLSGYISDIKKYIFPFFLFEEIFLNIRLDNRKNLDFKNIEKILIELILKNKSINDYLKIDIFKR